MSCQNNFPSCDATAKVRGSYHLCYEKADKIEVRSKVNYPRVFQRCSLGFWRTDGRKKQKNNKTFRFFLCSSSFSSSWLVLSVTLCQCHSQTVWELFCYKLRLELWETNYFFIMRRFFKFDTYRWIPALVNQYRYIDDP